jgi:hypothetical protein
MATLATIQSVIEDLTPPSPSTGTTLTLGSTPSPTLILPSLAGTPQETPEEVSKLCSALAVLSADVPRGNGSAIDPAGAAAPDYWLGVVWGIASLGWACGKKLAQDWSRRAPNRYDDAGFEAAWDGYDPSRPNKVGIGSVYRLARLHGWVPPGSPTRMQVPPWSTPTITPSVTRYRLLGAAELHAIADVDYVLKGILPAKGFASIYGSSGSGKSFLAQDLLCAIAAGTPWFGIKTKQAPAVWVALEGESGIKRRVQAWEVEYGIPPANFKVVMQPFLTVDAQHVSELASAIPKGAVVVIDTLNRSAPEIDENISKDMGAVIQGAKALQAATDGLVILVHHTGKDVTRGARGHSSFYAALDAAIEVERAEALRVWRVGKSKDGADGTAHLFDLKRHVLGKDSDGDELSSCTVDQNPVTRLPKRQPGGKSQKAVLRAIEVAVRASTISGRGGASLTTNCVKLDDAITAAAGTLVATPKNKRTNRARNVIAELATAGFIRYGDDGEEWVWVT